MLPTFYRLWAKTKLRHMTRWVQDWQMEEMYAGVPGKGLADGAYHTTLLTETVS